MNDKEKKTAGITAFARELGVSHTAINHAIATGRIPAHLIGTRPYRGRIVSYIADVAGARAAFVANSDPVRQQSGQRTKASRIAAADAIPSIAESRAVTEAYRGRLMQLTFERESGKLVDAEEFRVKFTSMVVTARTRLLGVPSKAKGRIPHLTIDEVEILTQLIREALDGLPQAHSRVQELLDSIRQQWWPLVTDTPESTSAQEQS